MEEKSVGKGIVDVGNYELKIQRVKIFEGWKWKILIEHFCYMSWDLVEFFGSVWVRALVWVGVGGGVRRDVVGRG